MIALVLALMNFVADLLYMVLDPRVSAWPKGLNRRPQPHGLAMLPVAAAHGGDAAQGPVRLHRPAIYVLFALVALFADQLAPIDPMEILFTKTGKLAANVPPGAEFPLGTTNLGRDIYAQLVYGTRSALAVGLSAAVIVATVGTIVGLRRRLFRRHDRCRADAHRRHGAQPALPALRHRADGLFGRQHLATSCSPSPLLLWPNSARVIRSQVLTLRERAYRRGRARHRRQRLAHPVRAHRAQHPAAQLPLRLDRHRLGDHHRGQRQLPRLRRFDQRVVGHACCRTPSRRRRCRAASTPGSCRPASASSWSWSRASSSAAAMRKSSCRGCVGDDVGDDPRGRRPADPLRTARRRGAGGRRRLLRRRPRAASSAWWANWAAARPRRCAPSWACWPRTAGTRRRPRRLQGQAIGTSTTTRRAAVARHRLSCRKAR